jgi:hypothetical protein
MGFEAIGVERRFYASDGNNVIIEYPLMVVHTPGKTIMSGECGVQVNPEHETAHDRSIFRLGNSIAEAAIAYWEETRKVQGEE